MTPDQIEAENLKYLQGIRVLRLTSGRWAYFTNYTLTEITEELDPNLVQHLMTEQMKSHAAKPAPRKLTGADLLKELGL